MVVDTDPVPCVVEHTRNRFKNVETCKCRTGAPVTLLAEEPGEEELDVLHSLGAPPLGLRDKLDGAHRRALEVLREDEVRVVLLGQVVQHGADDALGVLAVVLHGLHDHLDADVLALDLAPAVIVRRHADHLVRDLGLARELGLGERGHVDDGAAPAAVHVRFRAGRELGSLCFLY